MITDLNNFVNEFLGSSALLRAHGSGGVSATINKLAPPKNFRAKPKRAGKKERGNRGQTLREGIGVRP